jgi:hypothetical protein
VRYYLEGAKGGVTVITDHLPNPWIHIAQRTRNGDNKVPTQINGRPRNIWLMELGYSSDTRYMDKVIKNI